MSFDRAVGYYDATRSLTPTAMAAVVDVLVAELADQQPVLEIGVGTGRVALPLAEAGLDVTGIDLAPLMLRELVAKDDGGSVPLAVADCRRLPFPAGRFGAVVASHVFHLVPDWDVAADEVFRVLRPGGVFLHARGGLGGRAEEVSVVFAEGAGIDRSPVGLDDPLELDAHLGQEGEWLTEVEDDRTFSIDAMIELLESGAMGWTWKATDEERRRGAAVARAWAVGRDVPSDRPLPMSRGVRFRRYRRLRQ